MAGAIEALASCFGMFTPPVMGAAAFIIAAFLGIPYLKVCAHAAVPCFLFYFSVFFMIDFHGRKHGLRGVPRSQLPSVKEVLAGQWFLLIPVIVLIWLLIGGYTPSFASFWAIILTFVISLLRRESRISLTDFIGVFEEGAKNTLIPATACAAAGIIIGSTTLSGLALKIGAIIISFSMDQLWLSLILIIILSVILGMGLPTTGVYITLAVTVIPIIEKTGVLPIGAHLFAFYYGVLSNVIPPVAIASFAAAGVAGAKPMKTAWNGFFMALPGLIVPVLFVYRPELLLVGNLTNIVWSVFIAIDIMLLLSAAIQGWFLGNLSWPARFAFVVTALLMCFNSPTVLYLGLGLSFLLYAYRAYRRNVLKSGIAQGGQT
jgi:TRAP transporter 4TM/12TM fusion protein